MWVVFTGVREKLNFCEAKKDSWSNVVSSSRNWIHPLCLKWNTVFRKSVQYEKYWISSSLSGILKEAVELHHLFFWRPKTVVPGLTERLGAKWPDVLHDLLSCKRATEKKIPSKILNWPILALKKKRERERDLKEGHGITGSKFKAGVFWRNSWESVKTQQSHLLSRTSDFSEPKTLD